MRVFRTDTVLFFPLSIHCLYFFLSQLLAKPTYRYAYYESHRSSYCCSCGPSPCAGIVYPWTVPPKKGPYLLTCGPFFLHDASLVFLIPTAPKVSSMACKLPHPALVMAIRVRSSLTGLTLRASVTLGMTNCILCGTRHCAE